MKLYNITVLEDVVSFRHNPVVLPRAPDAGVLQPGAEVLVHIFGGILKSAPSRQDDGVVKLSLLAGRLGIYPDDVQHLQVAALFSLPSVTVKRITVSFIVPSHMQLYNITGVFT